MTDLKTVADKIRRIEIFHCGKRENASHKKNKRIRKQHCSMAQFSEEKYKNGQMSDKHIEMLEALKVDLDPEKICR